MKRFVGQSSVVLLFLMVLSFGCNKPKPTLSGGKSFDYWIKNATSPDKKLRKEAVEKLGNVGNADPEVLPTLIAALHDTDAEIRCEAIVALLKVRPGAEQALDELQTMAQRDRDAKVRSYAGKAVEKLHQADQPPVAAPNASGPTR